MQENRNQVRTVQEEMARERQYWKRNQIWALVLAAVVLLNLLGGSGISVAPGAEGLMLTMHDGSTAVVAYDDILSAQLLDSPDYGSATEGKDSRAGKSGIWENSRWGSYTLCVYGSCSQAVRIETDGRCYVVNLPSEEETRQLYQIVLEKSPVSK